MICRVTQKLKHFFILFCLLEVSVAGVCLASVEKGSTNKKIEIKEESANFWDSLSYSLGYSVQSDLASELRPRLYSHLISLNLNYEFNSNYFLDLGSSFRYESLDRKIFLKKGSYGFNDFQIFLKKRIFLGDFLSASHSSVLALGSSFPLSEISRLEGHKAIPALSFSVASSFFDKKYTFRNNFSYHYLINTYEYSPSSGVASDRDAFSYRMSHAVKLIKKLMLELSFGFRYSKDIKGESTYSYNNSQSISYKLSKFHFGISYRNDGFTNDGDVSFWYIDKYRRNLKAFLVFSF